MIGITASGTTPYVIGALKKCQKENIITGCIVCNSGSPVADVSDYPVEVVVGSEFVTGSFTDEIGYWPEISVKYDFYFCYDTVRKSKR